MPNTQVASPTMSAIFSSCPPLPQISNPALQERVFTHKSITVRPTSSFENLPNDPTPDNESLEHLGDSVVNLCTTRCIQALYPLLQVGPASRMRALVVANTHLARFTQFYTLHFNLRGNTAQRLTIQASTPTHADLFEAYVGALFMEQGLEPVHEWLSAVLTPSIHYAYEVVRFDCLGVVPPSPQAAFVFPSGNTPLDHPSPAAHLSPPLPSVDTVGCTSLLNQYYAQRHKYLDWEFSAPAGSSLAPIWTVKAVVRGEGELSSASASTKKAAKNAAARTALISLGILQDSAISAPHIGTETA